MTISTTASLATFLGNGATSTFTFSFVGDSASDLSVIYTDADGNQTLLGASQYTLFLTSAAAGSLWGVGGTLTYPLTGSPIANGTSLTLFRTLPLLQTTSISNQGDFAPTVIERGLDTLCMQVQQVSARTGQLRGTWASGVDYSFGDVVQDGANGANTQNYYMCVIANTSTTWTADLAAGDWSLAIDVQTIAGYSGSAAASAVAASASAASASSSASSASTSASTATTAAANATTSETNAAASELNASTSATNAAASEVTAALDAAAAIAAANNAIGYRYGTSTSSNSIGTGAKTFTTQSGLAILSGGFITVSDSVTPANYLHGQVTSYSGTTLVVDVMDTGGTGTITSWNISPSSPQGPSGIGAGTVNAGTAAQLTYYAGSGTAVSGNANATISGGDLTVGQAGSVAGRILLSNATSGVTTIAPAVTGGGTITMPSGSGTILTQTSTQNLTNKTLTSNTNVLGGVTMTLGSDATGDIYYRSAGVLTRLPIGSATTVLHGGSTPSYSAVVEADITLADNTTNNASTSKHGFVKKLPNNAAVYFDGTGNYSAPAGGILASGYVTVSGTTPTLVRGTNCSVAYGGSTGNFIITFLSTLSTSNPIIVVNVPSVGGNSPQIGAPSARSSASITIQCFTYNGVSQNPPYFDFIVV